MSSDDDRSVFDDAPEAFEDARDEDPRPFVPHADQRLHEDASDDASDDDDDAYDEDESEGEDLMNDMERCVDDGRADRRNLGAGGRAGRGRFQTRLSLERRGRARGRTMGGEDGVGGRRHTCGCLWELW